MLLENSQHYTQNIQIKYWFEIIGIIIVVFPAFHIDFFRYDKKNVHFLNKFVTKSE